MHSSVPTAALRTPGPATKPPSQPGSGLFSNGLSATNSTPTMTVIDTICTTLSAMKPGACVS